MQEMKIRCHSQDHAASVVAAARKMGYVVSHDYKLDGSQRWDTLILHPGGFGSFWIFDNGDYPEYRLYGDRLLPVAEEWIENKGECPVVEGQGKKLDLVFRDGSRAKECSDSEYFSWSLGGECDDIIAYRLADHQRPAEDKAELTPCQQKGLRVGQWVWRVRDNHILSRGWVKLTRDDSSRTPFFYDPRKDGECFGELQYIDFTQGIHDSKPDWTPQPPIPDEAIAKAADAPVDWDGSGEPPVGARVEFPYGTAVIMLPVDSRGVVVLQSDADPEPVHRKFSLRHIRPIQSERDKAVNDLESLIVKAGMIVDFSASRVADAIYGAGYRKTENNNE